MKKSIFSNPSLDDITFEHRNHAYGAFAIRKNYDKNMSKATLLSIFLFVAAFISPKVIELFFPDKVMQEITEVIYINDLEHEPVIEKKIPRQRKHGNPEIKVIPVTKINEPTRVVNDNSEKINHDQPTESSMEPVINNEASNDNGILTGHASESGKNLQGSATENISGTNSNDEIFLVPDELPSFGEDKAALTRYLLRNITIPSDAIKNRIEGKVLVEFIIDKNGEVNSVRVVRGLGWGCDEEVKRVLEEMPKWNAGKHHGKPVHVKLILPVAFKYY